MCFQGSNVSCYTMQEHARERMHKEGGRAFVWQGLEVIVCHKTHIEGYTGTAYIGVGEALW